MSLVRLLTAGKSLIGLQAPKSRYHLHTQRPFPQFGSNRNPFRTTTRPEQVRSGAQPGVLEQQPLTPALSPSEAERGNTRPDNSDRKVGGSSADADRNCVKEELKASKQNSERFAQKHPVISGGQQALSPEQGERADRRPGFLKQDREKLRPIDRQTGAMAGPAMPPKGEQKPIGPVRKLGDWFGWRRSKATRAAGPFSGKPLVQGELSLDRVRVVRNDLSDSDLEVVAARRAASAEPAPKPTASGDVPANPWTRMAGRLIGVGKS